MTVASGFEPTPEKPIYKQIWVYDSLYYVTPQEYDRVQVERQKDNDLDRKISIMAYLITRKKEYLEFPFDNVPLKAFIYKP